MQELTAAGLRALALAGDVSNKAQVQAMVERTEAELGPLWLLVNNAGVLNAAPTAEMSEAAWDQAMAVDAKGVFLCCQAAIQRMIPRGAGRIVNFSSIAGHIVRTNQIAYCSAKAAVIHLSRCLAVEMAPHGITVNCLCPGMTWTQMLNVTAKERGLDLDSMVAAHPGRPHGRGDRPRAPGDLLRLRRGQARHRASRVGGRRTELVSSIGGGAHGSKTLRIAHVHPHRYHSSR